MKRVDLHLHSTASDGRMPPEALVEACAAAGLEAMALTDHDTVAGLPSAQRAADRLGLSLIHGVELGVEDHPEVHLLGYGLLGGEATGSWAFQNHLAAMREDRAHRALAIVQRLHALGLPLDMDRVRTLGGANISRSHIALAMVEAGFAGSVHVAFVKYLNPGRPAFVPRRHTGMAEGIRLIRSAGGVPVLAHPGRLPLSLPQIKERVQAWKAEGLLGIEAYHPSHCAGQMADFRDMARKLGLLITGGSDFHARAVRPVEIGQMIPAWTSIQSDITALYGAIAEQNRAALVPDKAALEEE